VKAKSSPASNPKGIDEDLSEDRDRTFPVFTKKVLNVKRRFAKPETCSGKLERIGRKGGLGSPTQKNAGPELLSKSK